MVHREWVGVSVTNIYAQIRRLLPPTSSSGLFGKVRDPSNTDLGPYGGPTALVCPTDHMSSNGREGGRGASRSYCAGGEGLVGVGEA